MLVFDMLQIMQCVSVLHKGRNSLRHDNGGWCKNCTSPFSLQINEIMIMTAFISSGAIPVKSLGKMYAALKLFVHYNKIFKSIDGGTRGDMLGKLEQLSEMDIRHSTLT